jgi:pyruvate dehydrogenase E2 component (dihydrolipoamide acetyltransferase)
VDLLKDKWNRGLKIFIERCGNYIVGIKMASEDEVRNIVEQYGLDLSKIKGGGLEGKVTLKDVEKYIQENYLPKPLTKKSFVGVRKTTAERLHKSFIGSAPVTLNMEVEIDNLMKYKNKLEKESVSEISITVLILKCLAKALRENIEVNSSLEEDDKWIIYDDININVAIDTQFGLLTPVLRNIDKKEIRDLLKEYNDILDRGRKGLLKMKDFIGGTFTVSNLGMFGIDSFSPIINPPQAAILGVNRIKEALKFDDNGIRKVKIVNLSLTFDHRIIDGAPAARFLQKVKYYIENPQEVFG